MGYLKNVVMIEKQMSDTTYTFTSENSGEMKIC